MARSDGYFTSQTASVAGKKSKRPSLDKQLLSLATKMKNKSLKTNMDNAIKKALIKLANDGNLRAIQEYLDRVYGKSTLSIDIKDDRLISDMSRQDIDDIYKHIGRKKK